MGGEHKKTEIGGLVVVLAIAAALRLWRLDANGFGTEYYAAGVRSMLQSGWLFFYNAFDPAGFLSLDKPPIAFWIQTAFAAALGYGGWVVHLPQALAGVASVAILHHLVGRAFGPTAALLAALLLAVTPVAVAVDRSNNTDSWLVFFLLLSAWLALRGRGLSLVMSMALLGLAFNVKMLAAFVCGPALLAGWLLAGSLPWRRRFNWATAAGLVLVGTSLSWSVAYDLTPPEDRPHVGSSAGNSMLELVVMHNGLQRFDRDQFPVGGRLPFKTYDDVPVGPLRLANPVLAAQFAWFLPLAALGVALVRHRDSGRASLALWGVWALTYGVVFSAAGGIFHLYYLSTLAPALAALAGVGCVQLWRRGPGFLAFGLALTATWQIYITGSTLGWTSPWLGFPGVALLAAAATLWRGKRPPAAIGGIALVILPLAWALSAVFSAGNLTLPSASLPRWLGLPDGRGPLLSRHYRQISDDPKLVDFLLAHRGSARFIAATPTALLAAPLIVQTGQPVMAFGGFFGADRVIDVEAFAERVGRGEVRYVLVGTFGGANPIALWALEHGSIVEEAQWRSRPTDQFQSLLLVDLKAD
jgi:4-amino-4-deoxy-L-arabinose transferase-like glycosyltransferase